MEKPNMYNHSKIYKLQCDDGYYYIGSTVQPLHKRLHQHKTKAKNIPDRLVYSHIINIGWDQVKIILVSEYNLENKEQLVREEDKLIKEYKDDPFCLNLRSSFMTDEEKQNRYKKYNQLHINERIEYSRNYEINNKEKRVIYRSNNKEKKKKYREENKEKIKIINIEYYNKNKESILNKSKTKYICECGLQRTIGNKLKHERTKKHIDFINSHVENSNITESNDESQDIAENSSSDL